MFDFAFLSHEVCHALVKEEGMVWGCVAMLATLHAEMIPSDGGREGGCR